VAELLLHNCKIFNRFLIVTGFSYGALNNHVKIMMWALEISRAHEATLVLPDDTFAEFSALFDLGWLAQSYSFTSAAVYGKQKLTIEGITEIELNGIQAFWTGMNFYSLKKGNTTDSTTPQRVVRNLDGLFRMYQAGHFPMCTFAALIPQIQFRAIGDHYVQQTLQGVGNFLTVQVRSAHFNPKPHWCQGWLSSTSQYEGIKGTVPSQLIKQTCSIGPPFDVAYNLSTSHGLNGPIFLASDRVNKTWLNICTIKNVALIRDIPKTPARTGTRYARHS
jgi:hypothetical protein